MRTELEQGMGNSGDVLNLLTEGSDQNPENLKLGYRNTVNRLP